MTVNFRILRSDKNKFDIIKVTHNDRQDAITKLEDYFKQIDSDYKTYIPGLSLFALYDNSPCGNYKNIMRFETHNHVEIIVQVKRIK